MQITLNRDSFNAALAVAKRIAERRNTIPILSNVLIKGHGDRASITATNLDQFATVYIACEPGACGEVTLPSHSLSDLVKGFSKGASVLLTDDGDDKASIICGQTSLKLQSLPASDFPSIDAKKVATHSFMMPAPALRTLLERSQFAISTEETRYYLNGVFLHIEEYAATFRAVATDGHRLACVETAIPDGADGMPGIIVPRLAVAEMLKLLAKVKDDVLVEMSAAHVKLTVGDSELWTKTIDGTFPDYARAIPRGNDRRLTVNKKALAESIKRVSAISSERGRAIKLSINGDTGRLTLSVNNPYQGTVKDSIDCQYDAYPSSELEIGFNARCLLDILAQIDGDEVTGMFCDPGSPTLFQDSANANALFVLVSLRV